MLAKSFLAVANPQATFPRCAIRKPKQFRLAKASSNNTSAETIEILERSARVGNKFNHLTSASTVAAFTLMVVATMSLLLMQLPGWLETQLQFSVGELARAIAGR